VGLLDLFAINPVAKPKVEAAAIVPYQSTYNFFEVPTTSTRSEAMQVPAVARARGIMCGTVGSLPLHAYNKTTQARVYGNPLLTQPDPSMPLSVTMSWTAEDLLFSGVAYWQVLAVNPEDKRPTQARRVDPSWVTWNVNYNDTEITQFWVKGEAVPMSGVGSLIMFNGIDEGILARGGRTIYSALQIEKAIARMASEPVPTTVLKNSGVDLPSEQVNNMLTAWKKARQERSTAYLAGNLDIQTLGFDATQMQLAENRMGMASEIARLMNIPAWYVNAEAASMTYTNVTSERRSLIDFSIRPTLIMPIEQRLSMPDITPITQEVRFSLDDYLRGNPLEQVEVIGKMLELGLIDVPAARGMLDLVEEGSEVNRA
jgi:HK97 family phage portal protein